MSEVTRTGFLIRGTKEKSEGDVFHRHHLHQIHFWTGLRIAFPCFIPLIYDPAATGCNASNTVWKIRTSWTSIPPQVGILMISNHHMWVVDSIDNRSASIALKKSRVRIPPGPLEYPQGWGILLNLAYIRG
jgi:hypothetical protein